MDSLRKLRSRLPQGSKSSASSSTAGLEEASAWDPWSPINTVFTNEFSLSTERVHLVLRQKHS